jgi:hypothetical protein
MTHKNRKVNKFHFLKCWKFSFDPGSLKMLDPDPDPQHCLEVIEPNSGLNLVIHQPKSPVGTKAG